MGLYERLVMGGENPEKLRAHPFVASLREVARGGITQAQLIHGFGLAGDDVTELNAIITRYNAQPTASDRADFINRIDDVFTLASDPQTRPLYTREFTLSRLGF